jgi:hypothetical protein
MKRLSPRSPSRNKACRRSSIRRRDDSSTACICTHAHTPARSMAIALHPHGRTWVLCAMPLSQNPVASLTHPTKIPRGIVSNALGLQTKTRDRQCSIISVSCLFLCLASLVYALWCITAADVCQCVKRTPRTTLRLRLNKQITTCHHPLLIRPDVVSHPLALVTCFVYHPFQGERAHRPGWRVVEERARR